MASSLGEGVYTKGEEEVAAELREEFIADTIESVQTLDLGLGDVLQDKLSVGDFISQVQRVVLPLRGQAGNYGVRLLGTVAHRFEDYISSVASDHPAFLDDVRKFIDVLTDILEGGFDMNADPAEVVRSLPAKVGGFSVEDVEVRNVEVMLVMLHGTATHFVEREMHQCGYRTTTVTSTFDALPLIVKTKPDLVVISAVMPDLDGIDLAVGLASMPATRNIPTALITSLKPDDPHLQAIPKNMPVIYKGASFGDDLADALESLFLI